MAKLEDLQASTPEVAIGLSRAGVTGVQKAVRIGRGRREKLIAATIDCTVDLDPSQKGVHMSRFPELFEEAIEGVVEDEAFLVEDLAEHVARRIVERQGSLLAEVRIHARYPYERRTPVTNLSTQEMVSLILWALLLGYSWPVVAFAGFAAAGVVLLHRANIRRLARGEESRFRRPAASP